MGATVLRERNPLINVTSKTVSHLSCLLREGTHPMAQIIRFDGGAQHDRLLRAPAKSTRRGQKKLQSEGPASRRRVCIQSASSKETAKMLRRLCSNGTHLKGVQPSIKVNLSIIRECNKGWK